MGGETGAQVENRSQHVRKGKERKKHERMGNEEEEEE